MSKIKISTATEREQAALVRLAALAEDAETLPKDPTGFRRRLARAKAIELERTILARDEGDQSEPYEVRRTWARFPRQLHKSS